MNTKAPPTKEELHEIRMNLVVKARGLIARGDTRWYDFCSSVGMIPGNVAHMRGIAQQFAEYCWPDQWAG